MNNDETNEIKDDTLELTDKSCASEATAVDGDLDNNVENLYTELINDVLFGLIVQVHRAAKLGYLFYAETDPNLEKQLEISNENDIFGINGGGSSAIPSNHVNITSSSRNNLVKYECVCPNCDRNLAAVRFAPHLEKCMGLGRNSSRIARRNIAAFNGDLYALDQFLDDDALSIQSSSSSIDADTLNGAYNYNLKPPNAKRKRLHASTSMQNLPTSTNTSTTTVSSNSSNGSANANLNTASSSSRFNFF